VDAALQSQNQQQLKVAASVQKPAAPALGCSQWGRVESVQSASLVQVVVHRQFSAGPPAAQHSQLTPLAPQVPRTCPPQAGPASEPESATAESTTAESVEPESATDESITAESVEPESATAESITAESVVPESVGEESSPQPMNETSATTSRA